MEFYNGTGVEKTRMTRYQNVKKCDDMSIDLDKVPALDRQTNTQTKFIKQYVAVHAEAC